MRNYAVLLALLCALAAPDMLYAQTGQVTGRIVSAETDQPLIDAQVFVVGTNRSAMSNQEGRFVITGVPAGRQQIRVSLVGYAQGDQTVDVTAGAAATADFRLRTSPVELAAVIVSASGREQRQRELGVTVGTINVPDVELAAINNLSQLIQGRVAGTTVLQTSGTTGTASRIRIRGANSISLSNAPLVIVDGVRVDNSEASLFYGVGGATPGRLDDISSEDIESIEILKGPAASAMYGTAAANGVIQITTRRGRAGAPEFRFWSELGRMQQRTAFEDNVYAEGTLVGGANVAPGNVTGPCTISRLAIGATPEPGEIGCTGITQVHRFNPLMNPETTPFRNGTRQTVGASVSGGTDGATFYVSAQREDEDGVQARNTLLRNRLQANFTGYLGDNATVGANLGYLDSSLQLPQGDNALFGIVPMGMFGDPRPANVEANQGYLASPQFSEDWLTFQDINRLTGSVRASYRPLAWLSFNAVAGMDRVDRDEVNRLPRDNAYSIFGSVYTHGFIQRSDFDQLIYTGTASSTATRRLSPDLVSTTSIGTQYLRERFRHIYSFGASLTPGIETSLAGATADFAASEENAQNATIAAYAEQQFAWRDRVYANAALRGDRNSAFGTTISWIWYPSISTSWVISEEAFFPTLTWLSSMRLRGAVGQSGLRPGATAALQSFAATVTTFAGRDQPAIVINQIGNPELRPERTTEYEVGFEAGLIEGQVGVELTYFNKRSQDALVNRPLPPSLGASAARFENLGEVRNSGLELGLNAQAFGNRNVSLNASLTGAWFRNELVDLGVDAQGEPLPDIIFNRSTQRHREGYALGSYFQRRIIGWEASGGNGLLRPGDVELDTIVSYMGSPFPRREVALNAGVTLWNWAHVSGLLDYKGGHKLLNYTRAFRCEDQLCPDLYDVNTPLERQAAILAYVEDESYAGFIEDADFVKLREVALTLRAPRTMAQRVGAGGLSLTIAGRNLHTWTRYTGFDPEVNFQGGTTLASSGDFITGDQTTLPANRFITFRIDANF
jgi:TonB-dependent starch-binding outer membrane protein SusC